VRRIELGEMVLPYALAVLLGLAAGFRVAPLVKGASLAPPAALVRVAPLPTSTSAAAPPVTAPVAPAAAAPGEPTPPSTAAPAPAVEVDGLPLLVVGDATVVSSTVAARLRSGAVTPAPRPTGWVQSYVSPDAVGTELMIVADGDDPAWAAVAASDETVATTTARVQRISDGGPMRVVVDVGGRRVAVSALGLDDGDVAAVVAGLAARPGGVAGVDATVLPRGLRLVAQGAGVLDTSARYRLAYGADDWFVVVSVDRAVPLVAVPGGFDDPVERLVVREVGGQPALVSIVAAGEGDEGDVHTIRWCLPDRVCASLTARGFDLDRAVAVAASVRPATPDDAAQIVRQ
jgi:hypothetical protein